MSLLTRLQNSLSLRNRILISTTLFFMVLSGLGIWFFNRMTTEMTIRQAEDSGIQTVAQFKTLRSYYTQEVVAKVKEKGNGAFTFSFDHQGDSILPLPATMIHDLSGRLEAQNLETRLSLFSDFPFPNRKTRKLDSLQERALAYFRQATDSTMAVVEGIGNNRRVRVFIPDRMSAQACIDCHNSHPLSPKKDWKIGDIRGILEVNQPIKKPLARQAAMAKTAISYALLGVIGFAILLTYMLKVTMGGP